MTLTNNFGACLFDEIRLEINGVEVDQTKNLGIASTLKNYLSSSSDSALAMVDASWHTNHFNFKNEALDLADWRALEYASYHHHGLQWDDGLIPYDRVAHYFERVLRSECEQDRNMRIYVSGSIKKLWLQQLAKEFFNSRADVTVVNLYDEFNISGSDYMTEDKIVMAKVYKHIELDENEISKIFREVLPEIPKKSASSLRFLERRAKKCHKIIGDILNSTVDLPQSTGRKEALEAKADRLKRIYLILERERLGRKESSVIFFEGESAFRRRIRSGIVGNIYHSDPIEFLKETQHFIVTFIRSAVRDLKVLKVNLIFNNYFNLKDEKSEIEHFKTDFEIIMESSNLDEWYEEHL
ncbi:hypothetical protein QAD02_003460 [Eretmocerus hayati]|uniref:Uncharacterized protein n=1 Tax=Eretmocerus hayati TaxID=131215 RepID=A0ACC2NM53_9HYME|nr:hypothetical protein QAD02_003460 [Eretmocerus hayati]